MEMVKLSVQVESGLRRRIKMSAAAKDESVKDWMHRAILRELEAEEDGEEEMILPPPGVKPRGLNDPPKPRGGGNVSDTILEDRR